MSLQIGRHSIQLDTVLFSYAGRLREFSLILSTVVAGAVLLGWLVPVIGQSLPDNWSLMKANTALGLLLGVAGLVLTGNLNRPRRRGMVMLTGALMLMLAGSALLGHYTGEINWFETMLALDFASSNPGLMSIKSAVFITIFACWLILNHFLDKETNVLPSLLTILLVGIVMTTITAYIFQASELYTQDQHTLTSPQTLICMALMTLALFLQHSHARVFSVFFSRGIGSQIARNGIPFALFIPVGIIALANLLHKFLGTRIEVFSAMTASLMSLALFTVLLLLSRRINQLENSLRDMSLRDEMTGLYNHRGFMHIGEHILLESIRDETNFHALYFDLDNLKIINDKFGHETGSELLREFSRLLESNFRESDLISRIGGDEFVVVLRNSELDTVLERFKTVTEEFNRTSRPYKLEYSLGTSSRFQSQDETLMTIVNRADKMMYEHKHQKKHKSGSDDSRKYFKKPEQPTAIKLEQSGQ